MVGKQLDPASGYRLKAQGSARISDALTLAPKICMQPPLLGECRRRKTEKQQCTPTHTPPTICYFCRFIFRAPVFRFVLRSGLAAAAAFSILRPRFRTFRARRAAAS